MSKRLNKGLNRKQVGVVVAAFAFTLVGGVVYAATMGVMNINGNVTRGVNVDLDFTAVSCSTVTDVDVPVGGGFAVDGSDIVAGNDNCAVVVLDNAGTNGANDRIRFGVFLRSPSDTVTINFTITNVGSVPAELASISTAGTTGFGGATGIALIHALDALEGTIIPVAGSSDPQTITVTWPANAPAETGEAEFVAVLNYVAAP
jgi:hypothetical protein